MSAADIQERCDMANAARLPSYIAAADPAGDFFVYDLTDPAAPAELVVRFQKLRGDPRPFYAGTTRDAGDWIFCKSLAGALSAARRMMRQHGALA